MKKYTKDIIQKVWQQAKPANEKIKDFIRQDLADAWIDFKEYGNETEKGWVITPILPEPEGNPDDVSNLMALHWKNNVKKGANFPRFRTIVSSKGPYNIEKEREWEVE